MAVRNARGLPNDEGSVASTSGVPQHTTPNGARGNLTSINQWLNTTGRTLTTTMTYEDTGDVLTSSDPGGHQTQFSYADNFAGGQTPNAHAYVTTVTLPTTHSPNTQAHTTTAKSDINTGLMTDIGDQHGNQITYDCYSILRPLTINYPDGGKTSYTYYYESGIQTSMWIWTYLNAAIYSDFRQHLDSLGRVDRTAFWNAQSNWEMRDLCFDADGRQNFASYSYWGLHGPRGKYVPEQENPIPMTP